MSSPIPSQVMRIPIPRGPRGYGVTEIRNWPCDPAKLQVFWGTTTDPRKISQVISLPFQASESLNTLQDVQFDLDLVNDPSGQTVLLTDGDVLTYDQTSGTWRNMQLSVSNISTPASYTDPTTGASLPTTGMVMVSDGAGGSTWEVPPGGFTFGSGAFGLFSYAAGSVPPGSIHQFATNIIPQGWLLCDGAAVSRTTYLRLFNAIGVTWGTGDGSTTFNLPLITATAHSAGSVYHGVRI